MLITTHAASAASAIATRCGYSSDGQKLALKNPGHTLPSSSLPGVSCQLQDAVDPEQAHPRRDRVEREQPEARAVVEPRAEL